ncbi:unnamed protein product [Enterobius vermicularis]|uniref:CNH domain-containing protein n=1 Tax=Enterobius vermicularis TaxID=51028 RepID=A0A0N4V4J3_ENTVE|nr:unnamed protein product [Enterobius vermicularis]
MDGNDNIVILHDNQIRSFKDAKNIYDVELISPARAITATDDQIIVLLRDKLQLIVLSTSLEVIKQIQIADGIQNTCNFVAAYNDSYYISCDSYILQISKDGVKKKRIGKKNGSYSLGITFDDKSRLIVVVRGRPKLRVFQNGVEFQELFYGEATSIWSEVLYERGRLHVIDYLSNTLNTFQYPVDLL